MAHRYIIGSPSTGKTTLLFNWLLSDIHAGHGACYFDFTGNDTDTLLPYIPHERRLDVVIFDPTQFSIPYNPLVTDTPTLTASTFVESIKAAWGYADLSTPRMDGVLFNTLAALIEAKRDLFGIYLMLVSGAYRDDVLVDVKDPVIKQYWAWYDSLPQKQQLEVIDSTLNKIQVLMADPRIRSICGKQDALNLPSLVDGKILIIRLPQGELGRQKASILASILLTQLNQAISLRDPTTPFNVYIDRVHLVAAHTAADMLGTAQKHNVTMTLVHEFLAQLDTMLRASVLANTEQYVTHVSREDAEEFSSAGLPVPLYEQEAFTARRYGEGKSVSVSIEFPTYPQRKRTAQAIISHHRRNLHRPADKSIDALCSKYLAS